MKNLIVLKWWFDHSPDSLDVVSDGIWWYGKTNEFVTVITPDIFGFSKQLNSISLSSISFRIPSHGKKEIGCRLKIVSRDDCEAHHSHSSARWCDIGKPRNEIEIYLHDTFHVSFEGVRLYLLRAYQRKNDQAVCKLQHSSQQAAQ